MRLITLVVALLLSASACRVVAPHQREHLAHPTMKAETDPLEAKRKKKLHGSREAASGGDGKPAGGGCGCSN